MSVISSKSAVAEQVRPPTTALDEALAAVRRNAERLGDARPKIGRQDLTYQPCGVRDWVDGFWPGQLWLAYQRTGDSAFRATAERHRAYFAERITRPADCNHDLGFLYSLSAVADFKLTGNDESRAIALRAADLLASRFRPQGQFIQAWNPSAHRFPDGFPAEGRMIIDCMVNLGLLVWATRETGDARYADIAAKHAETARAHLIRPDSSTFHSFNFDPVSGEPIAGTTVQGFADASCWSRGQAWGIHGFALTYSYTRERRFLDAAVRLAEYVAERVPDGRVPPWDYRLPHGAPDPVDSSAGAITAAGLLLLADQCDPGEAERWRALASSMLTVLTEECALFDNPDAQGLLAHGASFVAEGLSDNMLPYGDYFYLEALMREQGETEFFW